jgi:DnaK suppressor protein
MLDQKTIQLCKEKLLTAKTDLLNRYQTHFRDFRERGHTAGGDEADQSSALLAENNLFAAQQRLRAQIFAVENALARIERGTYGICEETEEPIEPERLLAIPWTTLSIEGAEIREDSPKVSAKV